MPCKPGTVMSPKYSICTVEGTFFLSLLERPQRQTVWKSQVLGKVLKTSEVWTVKQKKHQQVHYLHFTMKQNYESDLKRVELEAKHKTVKQTKERLVFRSMFLWPAHPPPPHPPIRFHQHHKKSSHRVWTDYSVSLQTSKFSCNSFPNHRGTQSFNQLFRFISDIKIFMQSFFPVSYSQAHRVSTQLFCFISDIKFPCSRFSNQLFTKGISHNIQEICSLLCRSQENRRKKTKKNKRKKTEKKLKTQVSTTLSLPHPHCLYTHVFVRIFVGVDGVGELDDAVSGSLTFSVRPALAAFHFGGYAALQQVFCEHSQTGRAWVTAEQKLASSLLHNDSSGFLSLTFPPTHHQ